MTLHFFWFSWSFVQDEGLDIISEGLGTLKNLAHDMNEVWMWFTYLCFILLLEEFRDWSLFQYFQELDRQVPLIDEIDTKVRAYSLTEILVFSMTSGSCKHFISSILTDDVLLPWQVDKVTSEIKSNNVRLKDTLHKVSVSWPYWSVPILTLCRQGYNY